MTQCGQLAEARWQMMKCLAGLCDPLPEHDQQDKDTEMVVVPVAVADS